MEDYIRNIFPEYHIETVDDIDVKDINVDEWYCLCEKQLKHLTKTTQYASEEIKWYVESMPLNTVIYNIYRTFAIDVQYSLVLLNHLRRALHCNLTYDHYDEFCKVTEQLQNKLEVFCRLDVNKSNLIEMLPECDDIWKPMVNSDDHKLKDVAEKGLEDSKIYHEDMKRMQTFLQVSIKFLLYLIDDVRKYRFYRKDEEMGVIYAYHLNKYKKEIYPVKWEKFKRAKLEHELKYRGELKSIHWVEIKNSMWLKFTTSELGDIYSNYYLDGDAVLANQISKKNVATEKLNDYFFNVCLQDSLDEEIESLRDKELNADPDFKLWVDLEKLKELLWAWIKVKIKYQYQWTAVICVFHELKLLKEDCTPNKLVLRLNKLFPKAEVKCTPESFRKYIGNKWDIGKECNKPIDTWSSKIPFTPLAKELLNKMSEKDKYRKTED